MGFSIYYRSTRPLDADRADAIREAAERLTAGRTWLSCEPVGFYHDQDDGRLFGGSKPNFQPHPDDVASAALEGLPDGTVADLIEILCKLSKDHGVDWEFSHDYDPGPIGFIRAGVCEGKLYDQLDAIAGLGDVLREITEEDDEDHGEGDLAILPFRPKDG
jgi:hypothetical protein